MGFFSGPASLNDDESGVFSEKIKTSRVVIGTPGVELTAENSPLTGTVAGFVSGGPAPSYTTTIQRFPFAILEGTAVDAGDVTQPVVYATGASSSTDGFHCGGFPTASRLNIEKFPFAIAGGTATDVGDLSSGRYQSSGHSSSTDGFIAGGAPSVTKIDKFPFSIAGGTATDVGDLVINVNYAGGLEDENNGFVVGGIPGISAIQKFPFAIAGGTSADVGDLTSPGYKTGTGSSTEGFVAFGIMPSAESNIYPTVPSEFGRSIIDKFPFAIASGNATSIGNLSTPRRYPGMGHSSPSHGFFSGGNILSVSLYFTDIDKFPFSIGGDAFTTKVGDLALATSGAAAQQD